MLTDSMIAMIAGTAAPSQSTNSVNWKSATTSGPGIDPITEAPRTDSGRRADHEDLHKEKLAKKDKMPS